VHDSVRPPRGTRHFVSYIIESGYYGSHVLIEVLPLGTSTWFHSVIENTCYTTSAWLEWWFL